MKLMLGICLLLAATVTTLHAQVRELWRSGLTNEYPSGPLSTDFSFYSRTAAAVDQAGNTIVGGFVATVDLETFLYVVSAFVAKFDSKGVEQWRYFIGDKAVNGVEGLAVDDRGCVYFSARPTWENSSPALLVKLSAEGGELWRAEEDFAVNVPWFSSSSTVGLDTAGNAFFLVDTYQEPIPGVYGLRDRILAKFDTRGRCLWRTVLPGHGYFFVEGVWDTMAVGHNGSVLAVGGYYGALGVYGDETDYAAVINSVGKVVRWDGEPYSDPSDVYSSVRAGRHGTYCAASDRGFTIFGENGRPIRRIDASECKVVDQTKDGGFLIQRLDGVFSFLSAIDSVGNFHWSHPTPAQGEIIGVVAKGRRGCVVAAAPGWYDAPGVYFFGFDDTGKESWRSTLTGYSIETTLSWRNEPKSLLRAPDGTYRLIVTLNEGRSPSGVAVFSLAIE